MTLDELITNASPEQLREALRVVVNQNLFVSIRKEELSDLALGYNASILDNREAITNALEGKE